MILGAKIVRGANEEEFQMQKKYLINEIANGNNKEFLTINNEAAFGKTLYSEDALKEIAMQGRKAIFVRQYIKECAESADRINNEFGFEIALAISQDNYKDVNETFSNFSILIITHERYINICKDKGLQRLFGQDRDVLVIDEEINMVEEYAIDENRIKSFDSKLPMGIIRDRYEECIEEILAFVKINKSKVFFKPQNDVLSKLKELKGLVKKNINKEYASQFNINGKIMTPKDFTSEIEMLETFLTTSSVAENKFLYNYNRKIKFFKLSNNIMLDANGDLSYIYKVSKTFEIAKQPKIVNHKNWIMNTIDINACKSNKAKAENLYDIINADIKAITTEGRKTLVVGAKAELENINLSNDIDYAYNGNLTGKNTWKHFNNCYIIHNPQFRFHSYILKYMFYSKKEFDNGENWNMYNNNKVYKFRNEHFENMRITTIAGEIYQAIKRINRDNSQNANIYLMNNDKTIIDLVVAQMMNIKVQEYKLDDVKYKETKKDVYNEGRRANGQCQAFIKLLSSLPSGSYKKSWVREQIGVKNPQHLTANIISDIDVAEFLREKGITYKGQTFIIQ